MGARRYAAKRDANEREIIDALTAVGCSVFQLSDKGVADLLVSRHGVNYLIEVKGRRGVLTDDQEAFVEQWEGQYDVVTTPEEALRVVGAV